MKTAEGGIIRHLAASAALAAALVTCGCSRAPIVLDMQFQPQTEDRVFPLRPCRVAFRPVIDSRSNTKTIGVLSKQVVLGNNPAKWVDEGIKAAFPPPGFVLVEAEAETDVVGEVELEKVYVQYVLSNFETSVTLRSVLILPGAARRSTLHRGSDVKANWFNGDGEIMYSLNTSLNKAVAAIAKDVTEACYGGPASEDRSVQQKAAVGTDGKR